MAFYIVHKEKIEENIYNLRKAFSKKGLDFQMFYSVKTNSAEIVLKAIKNTKAEFEILSEYEWNLVKKLKPNSLVLNGPAKSSKLVKDILNNVKLLYFNIDNDTDFEILRLLDKKVLDKKIKIGIRVYLDKEGIWNRFGYKLSFKNLKDIIARINSFTTFSGIHFHFSTNNFKYENYENILLNIKRIIDKLKIKLEFLDIGGGLPAANEFIYYNAVYEKLPSLLFCLFPEIKIMSEAGRNIVADAIDIEARVVSTKQISSEKFEVAIDTNIMHFPCFYEKKFWVEYLPLKIKKETPKEITIFGNSCMQIDKIASGVIIQQKPSLGDKVIIHNVGAYSFSQAANFVSKMPEVIYG